MASNSPHWGLKSKIFKGQFTEDLEQIYDAEGSPFLGTRRGMARPVFLCFPRLHFGGGTRFENGKIRSLRIPNFGFSFYPPAKSGKLRWLQSAKLRFVV